MYKYDVPYWPVLIINLIGQLAWPFPITLLQTDKESHFFSEHLNPCDWVGEQLYLYLHISFSLSSLQTNMHNLVLKTQWLNVLMSIILFEIDTQIKRSHY